MTLKGRARHAKGPPRGLHAAIESRVLEIKRRRDVEHAFATDLRDSRLGSTQHRKNDRNKTLNGKPHVFANVPGQTDHLMQLEFDQLAVRQEQSSLLGGQSCDQLIRQR